MHRELNKARAVILGRWSLVIAEFRAGFILSGHVNVQIVPNYTLLKRYDLRGMGHKKTVVLNAVFTSSIPKKISVD